MYIYKITNLVTNKIYIGLSQKTPLENPEYFGSGKIIRRSILKHGRKNFVKEILFECDDKLLLADKEQYFIHFLDSQNPLIGYNIHKGGFGGDTISHHPNKWDIQSRSAKTRIARYGQTRHRPIGAYSYKRIFKIICPDGEILMLPSIQELIRVRPELKSNKGNLYSVMKGRRSSCKGYSIELTPPDN